MENYFIYIFGILVSCLTYTVIAFRFIEERYSRIWKNKICYVFARITVCGVMMGINVLNSPVLNLIGWIGVFGVVVIRMYSDGEKGVLRRLLEITIVCLIFAFCEIVGYVILPFLIWTLGLVYVQPILADCLHMILSKLFIIIIYYSVVAKLWSRHYVQKFSLVQWFTFIIIIAYNIVILIMTGIVISNEMVESYSNRLLLLINMICIASADLFLLLFTKFTEENSRLKMKLSLTEQQTSLQYEYYLQQEEKYVKSIKILHDIDRHLNMIKETYQNYEHGEAAAYAKEIGKLLEPLIVKQYVNHPILNILLNDKMKYAAMHNINFQIEAGLIDLMFMEQTEIITIFGNILDNAIEACNIVEGNKYIHLKLDTYNDFICIQLKNSTMGNLKWIAGRPVSLKGKNHGIGLLNVDSIVKKYNGNMILEEESNEFRCSIIFNE